VDPLAALAQVISTLDLEISLKNAIATLASGNRTPESATVAATNPETGSARDTYTIEGTTGAHQAPRATLVYLKTDQGLELVWRIETDMRDNWMLSYVDATNAETILGVVDYAAHARYLV
jgi:hypothetical protein